MNRGVQSGCHGFYLQKTGGIIIDYIEEYGWNNNHEVNWKEINR